MPAEQAGSVYPLAKGFGVRYRDHTGQQRRARGFAKQKDAERFLLRKCEEIEKRRRGEKVEEHVEPMSLGDLIDEYMSVHTAQDNTIKTLRWRLKYARDKFGDTRIDRLSVTELRAWRKSLPEGSSHSIVKCLRQVLSYAVECGYIGENLARKIPNPEPKRAELRMLTDDEVEAVDAEMPKHLRGFIRFMSVLGLRPEEAIPLTHGDIDRKLGIVHVRRVFTDGQIKLTGKTDGSLRAVPIPPDVIASLPMPNLDPRVLVWPGARGGMLDWPSFRSKTWKPALRAAGVEYQRPYSMRHTAISRMIAGGADLKTVSTVTGTSLEQLNATYAKAMPDHLERARAAMAGGRERVQAAKEMRA
jgi:integrase